MQTYTQCMHKHLMYRVTNCFLSLLRTYVANSTAGYCLCMHVCTYEVRVTACVNPPSFEDADGEDEGEDEFVLLKQ